jgi:putative peptidoglycan lipid II flippase
VSEDGAHRGETIARRAGIIVAGTLSSRVLGAVRDAVMAALFPKEATDAFIVAFTIPNALRVLLGEGAASGAFVPVLTEVRETEGEERARQFFAHLTGTMLVVLAIVALLGIATAPWLTMLYASGYEAERLELTVDLTRLVFPYIFFMGLAALAAGALNAYQRFAVPAFAPALLNVALIAAAFGLVPIVGRWGLPAIGALAIGALVGGGLQLAAQLPALRRAGLWAWPRPTLSDPYVKKAFRLLGPLLAGLGVYQLNVALSRQLASHLPAGDQSYLYYGQRIVEIPQGMFALAIATAALPTLSRMHARGDNDAIKRVFTEGLSLNLFVALPSSVALVVLAEPVIAVFFGRGEFGSVEIEQTAASLAYQAAGVWAIASVRTSVPMFYAMNDTRTPVLCSGVNLLAFAALALGLMVPLGHVGIAIALSGASIAQLAALLGLLRRRIGPFGLGHVARSSARTALASLPMAAAAYGVSLAGDWPAGGTLMNTTILLAAILAGVLAFFVTAKLLRIEELERVLSTVRRRAGRP